VKQLLIDSVSATTFHYNFYTPCLKKASRQHQRLIAMPHWHKGKHITKCPQRSCWSVEKAITCIREGERISLWTAKIKPALFRATNSLPRKTRDVSRHFRRSYLKANRVSKSEETRRVEYAYNSRKCDDAAYLKLSKSVCAWWNYSLLKLARFLWHNVDRHVRHIGPRINLRS